MACVRVRVAMYMCLTYNLPEPTWARTQSHFGPARAAELLCAAAEAEAANAAATATWFATFTGCSDSGYSQSCSACQALAGCLLKQATQWTGPTLQACQRPHFVHAATTGDHARRIRPVAQQQPHKLGPV